MGYREYDIRLPAGTDDGTLREAVGRATGLKDCAFSILTKSLDARRKGRIEWQYRVGVSSPALSGGEAPRSALPPIEQVGRGARVAVVGSGPAGIFCADWLARAGFNVTVLERGSRVDQRKADIDAFEGGGPFNGRNNYSFGEGGAGTFSDGKLSSRSKGIGPEKEFIFSEFIAAGAPSEISWMTHPHLGSDNLIAMARRMRSSLEALGVEFRFDCLVDGVTVKDGRAASLSSGTFGLEADWFVFAIGHSAFETSRLLMAEGVPFRTKNFAIGFRAEHDQLLVNRAQWGRDSIPGVKAAEYRLTASASDGRGVYSFCMCPGGTVVPASAYAARAVVNGKSDYARAGRWANAAVVAGLSLDELLGRSLEAGEALDWLDALEASYFSRAGGYRAPAMTVRDFLAGKAGGGLGESSYPLGLEPADLGELLPPALVVPLREGLKSFCAKLRGYETGQIMGLESKTSSPIQALRHPELLHSKVENLFLAGEGSGWSGGIVSSAADGLKVAQAICRAAARG